jgi:hypothetical protein
MMQSLKQHKQITSELNIMTIEYTKARGEKVLAICVDSEANHLQILNRFFGGELSHLTAGILQGKIVEYRVNRGASWRDLRCTEDPIGHWCFHRAIPDSFRIKPEPESVAVSCGLMGKVDLSGSPKIVDNSIVFNTQADVIEAFKCFYLTPKQ